MRKFVIMGAQGCGKGTQAKRLKQELDLIHICVGDIFRWHIQSHTKLGARIKRLIAAGQMVDDETVEEIIRGRLAQHDWNFGFILDGFPRTLAQAKALDAMLAEEGAVVTKVVVLSVPDSVLEERICGRWIHKSSGRSYHMKYRPPNTMKLDNDGKPIPSTMLDDETGEELMQRPDDTSDALVKRLQSYHQETVPILEHYRPHGIVKSVNANQNMDNVRTEILGALERKSDSK